MTRVVITGLGAVSPVGNDPRAFWHGMKEGHSGAALIQDRADEYVIPFACQVSDFDASQWLDSRQTRRYGLVSQFAVAATSQAIEDAGLEIDPEDSSRIAVIVNTGGGGLTSVADGEKIRLGKRGPRAVSPFMAPNAMPNLPACLVSIVNGIRGPVTTSTSPAPAATTPCSTPTTICSAATSTSPSRVAPSRSWAPVVIATFARMQALSSAEDPATPAARSTPTATASCSVRARRSSWSRPKSTRVHAAPHPRRDPGRCPDRRRLPRHRAARRRHRPGPCDEPGTSSARRQHGTDIDAVFAHATSTPQGDIAETRAIKNVFGDHAYRMPVTATKSQLGHALGGAARSRPWPPRCQSPRGVICPTINYRTPRPRVRPRLRAQRGSRLRDRAGAGQRVRIRRSERSSAARPLPVAAWRVGCRSTRSYRS